MHKPLWHTQEGDSLPIVGVAIHHGHAVRDEVLQAVALDEATRLREEDPYTGLWAQIAETWVVANRSRFEVDLNRPRERAVYRTPEEAWGLQVWQSTPSEAMIARSLAIYDDFYATIEMLFKRMEQRFGRFVVLDIHSYCHRRDGPDAPPADPQANPAVNLGTGTLDRTFWAPVIENFLRDMGKCEVAGHPLDVRENVKFRGGYFATWSHTTFPQTACVLSIEFKKFFMDEWSGEPNMERIESSKQALQATLPGLLEGLRCVQ